LSWLLRLATRLHVSLHALASEFGINDARGQTHWWCRPGPELVARISERTGIGTVQLRQMTFEGLEPAYRQDEASGRFTGRRYLSWGTQHRAHRFAVCARCLERDETPYLRSSWLIGWTAICPQHRAVLIERCKACGASVRIAALSIAASFSPTTCTRCGAKLLDGECRPAHPSVERMQLTLLEAKRNGAVAINGIGDLTWAQIVAFADAVVGMVWTDLTRDEQQRVFRLYAFDPRQKVQAADAVYDCRHGSLQFLAWLLEDWPDTRGAQVAQCMLTRWLAAQRNRLCRHLRPRWANPCTAGPSNFGPDIAERLRDILRTPQRRMLPAIRDLLRAAHRTPEVMIKVISPGSNTLDAIERHLRDIDQGKNQAVQRDDGPPFRDRMAARRLTENWRLSALSRCASRHHSGHETPPKLVHKIILSMPDGTPPDKLLVASSNFSRERFAGLHRYALALHTDERHPHVHLVVKAVSEDGVRFNIRKATLRDWRRAFARHLRALGVPAKATQRTTRPYRHPGKLNGIYRPARTTLRK